jgi:hypothetical protein
MGSSRVVQPAPVAAGAEAVQRAGGSDLKDVSFEMLVLEVLLDATTGQQQMTCVGAGGLRCHISNRLVQRLWSALRSND